MRVARTCANAQAAIRTIKLDNATGDGNADTSRSMPLHHRAALSFTGSNANAVKTDSLLGGEGADTFTSNVLGIKDFTGGAGDDMFIMQSVTDASVINDLGNGGDNFTVTAGSGTVGLTVTVDYVAGASTDNNAANTQVT